MFLFLLCTGARLAEVRPSPCSTHVPLIKKEVNLERGRVKIRTAKLKAGQRSRERELAIPAELTEALRKQIKSTPGPYVFRQNRSLNQLFDRIIERAGIAKVDELGRKVTTHSFRHTFATLQASMVGFNPFQLKEILGHSDLGMTDRYCHPCTEASVIDISGLVGGGVKRWCEVANEDAGQG